MSYDISFCSNDLNTGITDSNYDFIPQLNSEDNISPLFNFSSGFQGSISYTDKDDIISENAYFNKNDTINNLIPSVKKDKNLKEQKISINERKNNCDNVQIKVINFGRKKKKFN